jgi:hypothetical protein
METNETIKRIDPKKVYNISEIRRDNLFPWIAVGNHISYVHAVFVDAMGERLLKAKITGSGRGREYKILGKNIINYLQNHDKNKN